HVLAHLDEAVAVARLLDEHGHADHVGEAAAGALQDLVDLREHLLHLRLEVVGDVRALVVARRGLAGDPDNAPALGHHAGRERARKLERGLLHVFGRWGGEGEGEKHYNEQSAHELVLYWSMPARAFRSIAMPIAR